jgi:NADPH:quinone reductase-like Zn-dependent oxidoreductase
MLIPMIHDLGREAHGAILRELAGIADAGALRPIVDDASFGLAQAGDAHARLTGGEAVGKVVIDV